MISNVSNLFWNTPTFLCLNDLEKLRHAVISFSINYGNVLISGIPAPLSIKLIQNSAARKWMWASKYDYIISVSFHWLIVNAHIDYKVLLLTTKALHCLTTQCITDSLAPDKPAATLFIGYTFIVIFERDSLGQGLFPCSFLTMSGYQTLSHYWTLGRDSTPIYFLLPKGYLSSQPTNNTVSFSFFF